MKYLVVGLSVLIMLLVPALALARAEQANDAGSVAETRSQGEELKERAQQQINKATGEPFQAPDSSEDSQPDDESVADDQPLPSSPRSQMARERMSVVAKQVESLLADPEREGGIGEQVRLVAREQQQAEVMAGEALNQIDAQPGFLKFLFGADPEQVQNLRQQVEQNRERIRVMRELADQPNAGELALQLQNTARALEAETEELDAVVAAESANQGILGWFRQLLASN